MTQRWRLVVLGVLFAAPVLFLIGAGSYFLYERGWWFWAWWPITACLALAYFLAWRWQAHRQIFDIESEPQLHWTERDKKAWQIVEERAKKVPEIEPDKLTNMNFYVDTARELALEIARVYHPNARDPVSNLTIPEILTVIELASHDLGKMVRQYLPAGHLLTIRDWQNAQKAVRWYQVGSNIYWAISALFAPYNTAIRYLASRIGVSAPLQALQQNILVWFFTSYLHRLGHYLIELNSGRLRVGAERYRELIENLEKKEIVADGAQPTDKPGEPTLSEGGLPDHVTITIMGQVKAGKSSLINALLGEQKAVTSVLPATAEVTRYEVNPVGIPNRLLVLDTVGYGHEGPREDQLRQTQTAAQQSDLLLLVVRAVDPGRHADYVNLMRLREWFASRPDLKMPRVLAVVTHIDLLSPKMEWDPPYDWQNPVRPKEQQIEQAVAVVKEQFGDLIVGAVPVCAAEGRIYGVQEFLLPTLATLLDESRAVALLRVLQAEANLGKVQKVFEQLRASGSLLIRVFREQMAKG